MTAPVSGLGLGRLLLALDRTLVELVDAPRGLDLPVTSVALVDADDVRLGLAVGAGSADVFFLLGVSDTDAVRWLEQQSADTGRVPVAVFVKEPSAAAVACAGALGTAVVAVEPRARWEHLYKLVNHAIDHHGDRGGPHHDFGTDLFTLAQSIADRTRGLVSIEDEQSHVLAYSASSAEADGLRRTTILGRAGPPEHLEWIGQWGIFDALRAGDGVVRVAERPELGLRPRLAVGVHLTPGGFAGTIWLQQGAAPLADDAEETLRGGAVLAARIMARLTAVPSAPVQRLRHLLGLGGEGGTADEIAEIAAELGVTADGRAALVGYRGVGRTPPADVIALGASAFRSDAQVASSGDRTYVLLPGIGAPATVVSWARGTVAALHRELDAALHAVVAAPLTGAAAVAQARVEMDRVFDSAQRHPDAFGPVTALEEAHTSVVLDEIVAQVAGRPRLIDPRVRRLRDHEPVLADTLRAYLDGFGDVAAVAGRLHVHPNTVRYRVRRIETLLSTSLDDPDVRLVLTLGLRATEAQSASAPVTNSSNRSTASSPSASMPRSGPASAR